MDPVGRCSASFFVTSSLHDTLTWLAVRATRRATLLITAPVYPLSGSSHHRNVSRWFLLNCLTHPQQILCLRPGIRSSSRSPLRDQWSRHAMMQLLSFVIRQYSIDCDDWCYPMLSLQLGQRSRLDAHTRHQQNVSRRLSANYYAAQH